MSLLYREAAPEQRAKLERHLGACPECRAQYGQWTAAQADLSAWSLPPRGARNRSSRAVLRWAAAAALFIAAILAGSRLWSLEGKVRRLESAGFAAAAVRDDARQQVATLASRYEAQRDADRRAFLAALEKIQGANAENYAALRKELETVAILTDAGLRHAQTEIANIAAKPAEDLSNESR